MSKKYRVGSRVKWSSSAGGITTAKRGVVVSVIPGGRQSGKLARQEVAARKGTHKSKFGNGSARDHESYLVSVKGDGNRQPRLYWPRTSTLKSA